MTSTPIPTAHPAPAELITSIVGHPVQLFPGDYDGVTDVYTIEDANGFCHRIGTIESNTFTTTR